MSELTIQRTPELIAAEINNIKDQTRHMVLYNSIEIGRRLIEAKSLIGHGEWGNWLEKSVDYSQRTANNLMRIFNEYGSEQITLLNDNAKSQAIANLSYTQAIALLEVPEEEREDFIKENDAENKSARELQKIIKERDEAKKAADEKALEVKKILNEKVKVETILKGTDELFRNAQKKCDSIENLLRTEKEKSEKALKNLEKVIADNKKQMQQAKNSGNNEEIEKLRKLLKKAEDDMAEINIKNKNLEEQLKDKPIDVETVTKEVIPEEVQKELQELRDKQNRSMNDEKAIKFKVQFNELSSKFKDLLVALSEIEGPGLKDKCKNAVNVLINEMAKKL